MKKIFSILLCLAVSHISLHGMSNQPYEIDKKNPNLVLCNNTFYSILEMVDQRHAHIVHDMLRSGANPNLGVSFKHHKGNLLSLSIYHSCISIMTALITHGAIPPQDDLKNFYALVESKNRLFKIL